MKTKRFEKKLVLNKKTIAHLENQGMHAVQGGATLACTIVTCGEPYTGEPIGCGTRKSDCCTPC